MPAVETRLSPDAALAAARPLAAGGLAGLTWPAGPEMKWKVAFRGEGGPAEVTLDDSSGIATPPKARPPETTARLMRRLHDGTGMGALWQTIIFIGGILPAVLAMTGVMMWLRLRRREMLA